MSRQAASRTTTSSHFALSIPVESLRPLIQSVLESSGLLPGWPVGRVSLRETEAAECIGVKDHVLRDLRLRSDLPHTRLGRTIVYTPSQLALALDRLAVNS